MGYIGYYGALTVYPGQVFHNILAGISPAAGTILRRSAEIVWRRAHRAAPADEKSAGPGGHDARHAQAAERRSRHAATASITRGIRRAEASASAGRAR